MRTITLLIGAFLMTSCLPTSEPDSAGHSQGLSPPVATSASVNAATSASPSTATSALSHGGTSEGKPERLDSLAATRAAQAKGLKVTIIVPNPMPCPMVSKPTGDPKLLEAKGNLAGTIVDIDGFFRTDMGIAEAVALLGEPVLCNGGAVGGYINMHLAPRDPSVRAVTLESHDGDLIGIIVEVEKPTLVDVAALEKRFGKSRGMPGPLDSFEAGSDVFSVEGAAFTSQLMFAHRSHSDSLQARQVHQIIFRRTSMIEILPEGFHSVSDVARLVALALRARAPEAVDFAGTLGLYNQPVNKRISFTSALPIRNIAAASVVLRDEVDRAFIRTLDVTFKAPIAGDVNTFARVFATAMGVPTPTATDEGKRKRLEFVNGQEKRGRVLLEWGPGGLRGIEVVRADGG